MTTPLVVEYRPDAAETVRASQLIQRRGRLGWMRWVTWVLLAGLTLWYRVNGVAWSDMGFLYFAALLLAALTIGAPFLQRWQLTRAYAESPVLRETQRYEFTTDALTIRGGPAATRLGWEAFHEAVETDEYFLLYIARRSAYYLPKHVFADPAAQDELRALLHSVLGDRARNVRRPGADAPSA